MMKHRLVNKNRKKAILAGLTTLSASAAMAVTGNHANASDLSDNLLGRIHDQNTKKEIIPDNAKNIFQHNKQNIAKESIGGLKLDKTTFKTVNNNPLKTFNDITENISGLFANANRKNETNNQSKVNLKAANPIIKTEDLKKVEILAQGLPTIISPAFYNLDNFFKFITLNQEFLATEIFNKKRIGELYSKVDFDKKWSLSIAKFMIKTVGGGDLHTAQEILKSKGGILAGILNTNFLKNVFEIPVVKNIFSNIDRENYLQNAILNAVEIFENQILAGEFLNIVPEFIGEILSNIGNNLPEILSNTVELLSNFLGGIGVIVSNFFKNAIQSIIKPLLGILVKHESTLIIPSIFVIIVAFFVAMFTMVIVIVPVFIPVFIVVSPMVVLFIIGILILIPVVVLLFIPLLPVLVIYLFVAPIILPIIAVIAEALVLIVTLVAVVIMHIVGAIVIIAMILINHFGMIFLIIAFPWLSPIILFFGILFTVTAFIGQSFGFFVGAVFAILFLGSLFMTIISILALVLSGPLGWIIAAPILGTITFLAIAVMFVLTFIAVMIFAVVVMLIGAALIYIGITIVTIVAVIALVIAYLILIVLCPFLAIPAFPIFIIIMTLIGGALAFNYLFDPLMLIIGGIVILGLITLITIAGLVIFAALNLLTNPFSWIIFLFAIGLIVVLGFLAGIVFLVGSVIFVVVALIGWALGIVIDIIIIAVVAIIALVVAAVLLIWMVIINHLILIGTVIGWLIVIILLVVLPPVLFIIGFILYLLFYAVALIAFHILAPLLAPFGFILFIIGSAIPVIALIICFILMIIGIVGSGIFAFITLIGFYVFSIVALFGITFGLAISTPLCPPIGIIIAIIFYVLAGLIFSIVSGIVVLLMGIVFIIGLHLVVIALVILAGIGFALILIALHVGWAIISIWMTVIALVIIVLFPGIGALVAPLLILGQLIISIINGFTILATWVISLIVLVVGAVLTIVVGVISWDIIWIVVGILIFIMFPPGGIIYFAALFIVGLILGVIVILACLIIIGAGIIWGALGIIILSIFCAIIALWEILSYAVELIIGIPLSILLLPIYFLVMGFLGIPLAIIGLVISLGAGMVAFIAMVMGIMSILSPYIMQVWVGLWSSLGSTGSTSTFLSLSSMTDSGAGSVPMSYSMGSAAISLPTSLGITNPISQIVGSIGGAIFMAGTLISSLDSLDPLTSFGSLNSFAPTNSLNPINSLGSTYSLTSFGFMNPLTSFGSLDPRTWINASLINPSLVVNALGSVGSIKLPVSKKEENRTEISTGKYKFLINKTANSKTIKANKVPLGTL